MKFYKWDSPEGGNCHSVCLAYITGEVDVPHFYAGCTNGISRDAELAEEKIQEWLRERGLYQIRVPFEAPDAVSVIETVSGMNPGLLWILSCNWGGCGHSVVVRDGEIVCNTSNAMPDGPMANGFYEVIFIGILGEGVISVAGARYGRLNWTMTLDTFT